MNTRNEHTCGNDEYAGIISDIRQQLNQIFFENNLDEPNGLIAINDNELLGNNLTMRIYPLNLKIVNENIPASFYNDFCELINHPRPYKSFLHYQNLWNLDKLSSDQHFYIFNDKDTKNTLFSESFFDASQRRTWSETIDSLKINPNNYELLNRCDLLYFKQNTTNFIAIPLPILSTPTILIVIANNFPKSILSNLIRSIIIRTKDSVYSYVYNRLINNLSQHINNSKIKVDEEKELVIIFCQELNKVLLPVSYQLGKINWKYIEDWPHQGNGANLDLDSAFQMCLNDYKVKFDTTSFHFPVNAGGTTNWFHTTKFYHSNERQVRLMLENIYQLIFTQWQNLLAIKFQSQKSAMAAIMSRNMSHNIGSHVLPGVQELLASEKENRTQLLKELKLPSDALINKNNLQKSERDRLALIEEEYNKDKTLQLINKHIQERMEFIADINMAEVFMSSPIRLMDVIDDLAKNEKFIHYLSGGANVKIRLCKSLNIDYNELLLNFPNDLMGVQALFIVIENILRNAIKHSSLLPPSNFIIRGQLPKHSVQISIKVSECKQNPNLLAIDVFDNLGRVNSLARLKNGFISNIQSQLDAESIDPKTNQIKSGGWGMLEMRIAAAYLIGGLKFDDNFNKEYNQPIISAHLYDNKGQISKVEANLGYRFYMKKNNIAIVFLNKQDCLNIERLEQLAKFGIKIKYIEDQSTSIYPSSHQFLIVPQDANPIICNQRIVYCNKQNYEQLIHSLKNDDLIQMQCFIWSLWVDQNWLEKFKIYVDVVTTTNNTFAFFDSHGDYLKKNLENKLPASCIYYESYGSQSYTARVLKNIEENEIRQIELIECIRTKVAIVDERIQNAMEEKDNNLPHFSKRELLEKMGISIPAKTKAITEEPVVNLEQFIHNPETGKKRLEEYLKQLISNKEYPFVIVHLTLFEMLCSDKTAIGIEQKIKTLLANNTSTKLILTSGRGTPSNLPKACYFLHFSVLQNHLIYNRSKFSLVKTLYSVRRK